MSALGLDDRRDAGDVTSYAPWRARRSDSESSIRPVLERLSRTEGREPGPRLVGRAVVHHLPPPDVEAVAKTSVPMVARLTIAAGLLAAVAAGAVVFIPHGAPDAAVPAASVADAIPATAAADLTSETTLPKAVQTLAIRKSDEARPAPATGAEDATRTPQATAPAATADPVAAPLSLWAMMPADVSSSSPPVQESQAEASASPPPAATKPNAPAPAHKSVIGRHHARHVVHRTRHHVRHVARAAAASVPAQPAETAPAQTQPVKKLPLQAAIDRLFGNNNTGNSGPASQQ